LLQHWLSAVHGSPPALQPTLGAQVQPLPVQAPPLAAAQLLLQQSPSAVQEPPKVAQLAPAPHLPSVPQTPEQHCDGELQVSPCAMQPAATHWLSQLPEQHSLPT